MEEATDQRKQTRKKWTPQEIVELTNIVNTFTDSPWAQIAKELELKTQIKRTPRQCRDKWFSDAHPNISYEEMKPEEIDRLVRLVALNKENINGKEIIHWRVIQKNFPTRSENRLKNEFKKYLRRQDPKIRPRHRVDNTVKEAKKMIDDRPPVAEHDLDVEPVQEGIAPPQIQLAPPTGQFSIGTIVMPSMSFTYQNSTFFQQ